jgi:hypothetical protein
MLDHHPRVAFKYESEYLVMQISDDGVHPEIGRYHEWLKNNRAFESSGLSIDEKLDFVALVNDFLIQQKSRDNKDIVGTTIHYQFCKLVWIWPRAKYIYLYRDGRDVANSVMRMGWAGNVYVAADWWLDAEKEWVEVRQTLDDNMWIEVCYEELIRNARPELERICTFLGVEYSEKMFDYVKSSTYRAPDVSMIYQWKTGMRKIDVQRLEEKLGDRLLNRGYELSGYPRISVVALLRKYLYLQSRVSTFLFRLRRYGIALTLQETLSRRFGLNKFHRNAISKKDRIDKAYLK